jgi:lysozyme family protein
MQFESVQRGYANLWSRAEIRPEREAQATAVAEKIAGNRERYEAVSAATGCPWWLIGCIHSLEASLRFDKHLHNGDPLTARTVQVPKGRPKAGKPPFTWEESAVDALTMPPHNLDKVPRWPVSRVLYECERFNGFGYFNHAINSPYLWSFTTLYERGKYTADGRFSTSAVSKQCGAAAILKAMVAAGIVKL